MTRVSNTSTRFESGWVRVTRTLVVLLLPLAIAVTSLGASTALAIGRTTVIARAQNWVDKPGTYSQKKFRDGYRKDCSGYVSMCWKTGTSHSTRSFSKVTTRIRVSSLRPGDALLKKGEHIRLFYGWLDATHTDYVAYEAANDQSSICLVESIQDDLADGYVAVRYKKIANSPASSNLLKNPSFNVWGYHDSNSQIPLWWQVYSAPDETVVSQAMDAYHTSRSSVMLTNSSQDPAVSSEFSQSVGVTAGQKYRFKMWAATPCAPSALAMGIQYLDAAGQSIQSWRADGAMRDPDLDTSFKAMSFDSVAPAGAVRARVSLRLAGGVTPGSDGQYYAGTAAWIDDVSLTKVVP